ncbi:MAG: deoxyribonuclease IV [Gemmatales bacterium]|nr:deoxyribonuclease IV [Gemmatales bacterium]
MPYLGAHLSIAGGYYKSLESAQHYGMQAVQLFTKNNTQWRSKPITESEVQRFQQARQRLKPRWLLAHDSYLINLASPQPALYHRSIEALIEEWHRAHQLGLDYLVVHPGAHGGAGERAGLDRIIAALAQAQQRCSQCSPRLLIENTAGQGTSLGWQLEQLAYIVRELGNPTWLGFCLDTCHLFAAGYPLTPRRAWLRTLRQLDTHLSLERIYAWHLNDSAKPFASRLDRHAHIGYGHIGLEGFRHVLHCRQFRQLPMILETPKGHHQDTDWDARNLETLQRLLD